MSDIAASGAARVYPRSSNYSWQNLRAPRAANGDSVSPPEARAEMPREIQIAWGSAVLAAVMDSRNSGSAHGDASASPNDRLP